MGKSLEIAVRSFPNVDRGELQLWDRERGGGGKIGVGKRQKRKEPEGKVSIFFRESFCQVPQPCEMGNLTKMERKEQRWTQFYFARQDVCQWTETVCLRKVFGPKQKTPLTSRSVPETFSFWKYWDNLKPQDTKCKS